MVSKSSAQLELSVLCVGRASLVDDACPSLVLLQSGVRACAHIKIARGTGQAALGETLSECVNGDRSRSASRPA